MKFLYCYTYTQRTHAYTHTHTHMHTHADYSWFHYRLVTLSMFTFQEKTFHQVDTIILLTMFIVSSIAILLIKNVILLFNFTASDEGSKEQPKEDSDIPVLYIAVPTGNAIVHCL